MTNDEEKINAKDFVVLTQLSGCLLNEAGKISIFFFLVKARHFLGAPDHLTSTLMKYFSIGHFGRELARE